MRPPRDLIRVVARCSTAALVGASTLVPTAAVAAGEPIVTPVVSPASPDGTIDWYVSSVDVSFTVDLQGQTEVSRSAECDATTQITTDTAGTDVICVVVTDGGTTTQTVTIKRDATDPTLSPVITPSPLILHGPGDAAPGADDATSGVVTKGCGAVDTSTAGDHTLQCQATDLAGNQATQNVGYTVLANGPADTVTPTKGDGQVAYVNSQFTAALEVTVTDAQGNPVPGATVSFHAPLTGASADLARLTKTTNDNGVAAVRAFANDKVGSYAVRGKVAGAGSARFDLRNAPAPYFSDRFSNGLRKWRRTGDVTIAKGAGRPAPSALLRANGAKTYATHHFGDTYASVCASAEMRLNSLGNEAIALLRLRGPGDAGIARVSVERDRELFVRNDHRGGVKLSGRRLPLGEWHRLELCTDIGTGGTVSLYLDGVRILRWDQRLGDRRIAAIHLVENDVKSFSLNVDDVLVDRRPGEPL